MTRTTAGPLSPYTLRRHPIRGPVLVLCFRAVAAVLTAGASVALFFGVSSGSPIRAQAGFLWTLVGLLLPYAAALTTAWLIVGVGVWRGVVFVLGCVALAGVGVYGVARAWFFVPLEAAPGVLRDALWMQWGLLAATVIVAVVPGRLLGFGLDRIDRRAAASDSPDDPETSR